MDLKQAFAKTRLNFNYAIKRKKLKIKIFIYSIICYLLPNRKSYNFKSQDIKKILIIRNDRIGDMVVTTAMIRNLALAGYQVFVCSYKNSLEILKYNPYVKGCYTYCDHSFKSFFLSLKHIRKERFDLAIEVKYSHAFELKQTLFSSLIQTRHLAGFNKSNLKSYNISVPYHYPNHHVTQQLTRMLEAIGVEYDDMHYELFSDEISQNKAKQFVDEIKSINKKLVVINPFGSNQKRNLTAQQLQHIIELFDDNYQLVIIGEANRIHQFTLPSKIEYYPSASILNILPLLQLADLVITVDTSIVHIAACYQTTTIAYYLDTKPAEISNKDLKSSLWKQYVFFKNKELSHFTDREYLKSHTPDWTLPINHLVWHPNNPNAKQLVFMYKSFTELPISELTMQTCQALTDLKFSSQKQQCHK